MAFSNHRQQFRYYPHVWQEFCQLPQTLGAGQREYPHWHKGRERYYVWALDVDVPQVNARLQRYRQQLARHIVDPYLRQAHITVAVSGFLVDDGRHNDDVSAADINRQVGALHALNLQAFSLTIGNASSFASAPFLEVVDATSSLEKMRRALMEGADEFRTVPYVPHVTIGIYNGSHAVPAIADMLANDDDKPCGFPVSRVGLYSYSAADIGSLLRLEKQVQLA